MLQEAYKSCPATVQKVIDAVPANETVYIDPLIQIKMKSWYKDNVVLLGDAAHCLTLLSGQGASTAFWGASVLANGLIEGSVEDAFKKYQDTIMPDKQGRFNLLPIMQQNGIFQIKSLIILLEILLCVIYLILFFKNILERNTRRHKPICIFEYDHIYIRPGRSSFGFTV